MPTAKPTEQSAVGARPAGDLCDTQSFNGERGSSTMHSPNENLRLGNFIEGISILASVLSRTPE
jgi:acetylornithine deacetylase/succinyl-diaminopimelate desuccinylase-like protein